MIRKDILLALASFLAAVPCLASEQNASDAELSAKIDLPQLVSYALVHNPEIQAMEQRWRAAKARPPQEGALPDPMLNTSYHNEGFEDLNLGSADFSFLRIGGEQEFPFPGKLALRETRALRDADRDGAIYYATRLSVRSRLRLAYNDYYVAGKSIEVVTNNKQILDKLARAAESRYGVGEGLQQDVARSQVELSILVGRLASLEQARQSAAAEVNKLLNRPPSAPLGVPAAVEKPRLAYSLEQLEHLATERSPILQAAGFQVASSEANLALAKRQYYPDFVVRVDYFNKGDLTPEWEVGLGVRVPLYFWKKQANGVSEAAASVGESHANRQSTSQEVLAKLRDVYAQATSAERLVELYGAVVRPQAELALESALAAYRVGKVDYLSVLNSFTVLNDYRVRYYEELAAFDKAVAQIEELAGIGLDDQPDPAKRGGSHDRR